MNGRLSSFQSPVCKTMPSGVRIASADDSGTECDIVTNSTSNGPICTRPPSGICLIGNFSRLPNSCVFDSTMPAVNGVA